MSRGGVRDGIGWRRVLEVAPEHVEQIQVRRDLPLCQLVHFKGGHAPMAELPAQDLQVALLASEG